MFHYQILVRICGVCCREVYCGKEKYDMMSDIGMVDNMCKQEREAYCKRRPNDASPMKFGVPSLSISTAVSNICNSQVLCDFLRTTSTLR